VYNICGEVKDETLLPQLRKIRSKTWDYTLRGNNPIDQNAYLTSCNVLAQYEFIYTSFSWHADALASAVGEDFWSPTDYDAMAQRLLTLLLDGLALKDNRFMRVTADGSYWVVRLFKPRQLGLPVQTILCFRQVKQQPWNQNSSKSYQISLASVGASGHETRCPASLLLSFLPLP
jgi:hypothetical protein